MGNDTCVTAGPTNAEPLPGRRDPVGLLLRTAFRLEFQGNREMADLARRCARRVRAHQLGRP